MNHLTKVLLCCLTALWLSPSTALAQSPAGNVLYVNASAGGIDDGTSWANAYTSLQDAIAASAYGDEIWVAAGTYKPTAYPTGCGRCNSPRDYTFLLKNGVKLYGGFAGTETQRSERDWEANVTILSGDIGQDDSQAVVTDPSTQINGDNAYTVVTGSNIDNTAVIDGFTVTAGQANGASTLINDNGGGFFIQSGSPTLTNLSISGNSAFNFGGGMYNSSSSSPTLTNVTISGNSADFGGGMYNLNNSSPTLTNVTISGNSAFNFGGGMYNTTSSSPSLSNVVITGNNADNGGGGMYNTTSSSPSLSNVVITGNNAVDSGGGMVNESSSPTLTNVTISGNSVSNRGGGMFNFSSSSPTLTNVTISGNSADSGGGMSNLNNSSPILTNVTISGNSADSDGGGMFNTFISSPSLTNTIIWDNSEDGSTTAAGASIVNFTSTPQIAHCLIANSGGSDNWDINIGFDDGDNIDMNPLFINGIDPANAPTTAGDFRLQVCSAAIDAGNNMANTTTTDLDGNPRIFNSGVIDMGAYELQSLPLSGTTLYVNASATGANNGTSWTDAYTDLQDALDNNCAGVTEIWVAAGTYKPSKHPANCNGCNSPRDNTFQLKDGIALYGGFNGTESLLSERDFENNTTILSGDYNDDDTVTGSGNTLVISNNNENAYHVVLAAFPVNDTTSTTRINGFTITGGNANVGQTISVNGINYSKDNGGGIYTILGKNTILNNKIEACTAGSSGGGIFLNRGINTLTNNTISVNRADSGGGAYILFGSNTFSANTISNNTGSPNSGGGMNFRNSNSTLTNNIISMNLTPTFGGGINFEDGTYVISDNTIEDNSASIGGGLRFRIGNVTLTNNQITNNEANLGGGIFSGTTFGNDLPDNGTFIFTGNTISGNTSNNEGGGGWINRGNYTLTNNTISNNTAVQGGGGFFIRNSTTTSNENTIFGNSINSTTGIAGGGFVFINGTNSLSKNTIADNSATNVGGILFQGGINNLTGNRVTGNTAIAAAGGIFTFQGTNTLTNNSFYSNTASIGGGMYLEEGANALVNNSFTGNTANTNGGGMYFDNSSPTITNTIIWNNTTDGSTTTATASVFSDNSTPTFSHSLIANSGGSGSWVTAIGTDGGNNIDADPLFVAPSTPGLNTGGDYRLQPCSPAINAGSNAAVPSGVTTDLDGNPRFFNNGTVDMGAYEFQGEDNENPVTICPTTAPTVMLDGSGNGTLAENALTGGNSTDNCSVTETSPMMNFTCADAPTATVVLTATDAAGNTNTASCLVNIRDNIAPVALCQNVTVQLDANGNGSIPINIGTPAFDNGSSDACGTPSLSLSQTSFGCADVGANTVTLTATDVNGNSSSCTATVTVEDNVAPNALCQNVTVQLDANGNGSIPINIGTPAVDNGSNDACGVATLSLSQTSFGCADVGGNTVTLTATDVNGNSSSCTATVTVEDNIAPTAQCQNTTVQLDANGNGSTTPQAVDNGSNDACGTPSLSLNQTSFGCADVGANTVTLTATDNNGNSSTCTATVTVQDNVAPTAICLSTTVAIQPDGTYSLQEADVFDAASSFDNCGITQVNFPAATYTCNDVFLTFPVNVTISDAAGNSDNCTASVYIEIGTALPAGWSANDIGQVTVGNAYSFDPCSLTGGDFTITGSGNNATSSTTDNIAFAYQTLCGDGMITAKVESVDPNGYGGLMIRETTAAGSKQVAIFSNLTNVLRHESRAFTNAPKQVQAFYRPNPFWLRLQRQGAWVFAYYSTTGSNFQYVHAVYVPMQSCVEIGLASFTNFPNQQTDAVFSNVVVIGGAALIDAGNLPTAETQNGQQMEPELFPNPANSQFTLRFPQALPGEATATLRNQIGQVVDQRQLKPGDITTEWNVSQLPAGLYFMEVRQEGLPPRVLRVVKTQ